MFYDIFSDLCQSIGKSPTGVALELNIQRGTVSNWKNNGSIPNPDALKKIAEYFDVSVDDLLNDDTNCGVNYGYIKGNKRPCAAACFLCIGALAKTNPPSTSLYLGDLICCKTKEQQIIEMECRSYL